MFDYPFNPEDQTGGFSEADIDVSKIFEMLFRGGKDMPGGFLFT